MDVATTGMKMFEGDRVRANTAPAVNRRIDQEMRDRIVSFASRTPEEISHRIAELDKEWDLERWLECNASALAFSGVALGSFVNRKWLLLPAVVLPFLFLHALQGWCPPMPLLRRFGVRTRREIDAERYALRLLRGDFDVTTNETERALRALEPELQPVE